MSVSAPSKRLLSLDVLRGMTVFGMILVNNAGGELSYHSLQHSTWNGMTPCDLVFPFFLFIMGISTYIALRKFQFHPSGEVIRKILRRTFLILCIGWAIHWFEFACEGNFWPFSQLRLPGVLPRIAICYGIVSLMALYIKHNHLKWIAGGLLIIYTFILCKGNGYAQDSSNILAIIDQQILGEAHLYHKSPIDPEGLVSTISAIAHTLIGFLCGKLIMETANLEQKIIKLFVYGFILAATGFLFIEWLPLNKRIWSPSYVLVTCGLAAMLQSTLIWFIDAKEKKRWSRIFQIFGVNPLFLYVLSEVTAIILNITQTNPIIYNCIHTSITNPYLASAIYSLLFVGVMGIVGYPLFKKKIYIKI